MGVENCEYSLKVSMTVLCLGRRSENEVLNSIRVAPIIASTVITPQSAIYCQR